MPKLPDFIERKATGLDGPYYDLPEGATQLQDLIEHKNMNFAVGNIFKACYRLNDKADSKYNLEKIIFYADRELERLKSGEISDISNTTVIEDKRNFGPRKDII